MDKYLKRCIELASNSLGNTYPNPMVGSVIVYNDTIIGEGWHHKAGEPHAEVLAIQAVEDQSLLKKSCIYVSLEPCAHFGKTPPCADLIIQHKIPKVVIGIQDPFSEVNGLGIKKLKEAGIEVEISTYTKEFWELNKRFFTFHQKKRPYIVLKWAQTADYFIDKERLTDSIEQHSISSELSKQVAHQWRSQEQAIMVGKNTVLHDNPSLTTRLWHGNNPVRIVLDSHANIPKTFNLFTDGNLTYVINTVKNKTYSDSVHYIKSEDMTPKSIVSTLYQLGIQSILIEGGKQLLQSFIDNHLWDEARVFTSQTILFDKGITAPELQNKILIETKKIDTDILNIYSKNNNF